MAIDHDRLFKELLTTFFAEFIELFLPRVATELDRKSIQFLDKEIFTDLETPDRHEVDLLAKVQLSGSNAFILIHVENQSSHQPDFPRRMFRYYSRIEAKFNLPVYPIALFSYEKPLTPAPGIHAVTLFDRQILRFEFDTIQLNTMDWRKFLATPNPIASALMVKMQIAPEDRPRVKAQCARMMATLRLDPARSSLIGMFMNTYLRLSAAEIAVYNRDMQIAAPTDKTFMLEIENEWTEMGMAEGLQTGLQKGLQEGQTRMVTRLLSRRFGNVPAEITEAIGKLAPDRMDDFVDALLDFKNISDALEWLALG